MKTVAIALAFVSALAAGCATASAERRGCAVVDHGSEVGIADARAERRECTGHVTGDCYARFAGRADALNACLTTGIDTCESHYRDVRGQLEIAARAGATCVTLASR